METPKAVDATLEERARKFWDSVEWDGKRDAPQLFAAFARTLLEEARKYMEHGANCNVTCGRKHWDEAGHWSKQPCNCGLDELLWRLAGKE